MGSTQSSLTTAGNVPPQQPARPLGRCLSGDPLISDAPPFDREAVVTQFGGNDELTPVPTEEPLVVSGQCRSLDTLWLNPYVVSLSDLSADLLEDALRVEDYLWTTFVKDYFSQRLRNIESGDIMRMTGGAERELSCLFRVTAAYPWSGIVCKSTRITISAEALNHRSIKKLQLLPVGIPPGLEGGQMNSAVLFQRYIKPFFQKYPQRHLILGETVLVDKARFKVVSSEPSPDGYTTANTETYLSGNPLTFYEFIELQPVENTLPTAFRGEAYTGSAQEWLYENAILPHFTGRDMFLKTDEEVCIHGGLRLRVVAVLPEGLTMGVVGTNTALALAEESVRRENMNNHRDAVAMRNAMQMMTLRPLDFRALLQGLQQRLPADDPRQEDFRRFMEHLALSGQFNDAAIDVLDHANGQRNRGASDSEILRRTMTWKYQARNDAQASQPEDDDKKTCRICLTEFEDEEDLQCLPCFHRFHAECSMNWLRQNRVCPICKTSIFATEDEQAEDSSSSSLNAVVVVPSEPNCNQQPPTSRQQTASHPQQHSTSSCGEERRDSASESDFL